jgi:hypothetical protein
VEARCKPLEAAVADGEGGGALVVEWVGPGAQPWKGPPEKARPDCYKMTQAERLDTGPRAGRSDSDSESDTASLSHVPVISHRDRHGHGGSLSARIIGHSVTVGRGVLVSGLVIMYYATDPDPGPSPVPVAWLTRTGFK